MVEIRNNAEDCLMTFVREVKGNRVVAVMNLSPYAIHADYYTGIYAGMYTDAMTGVACELRGHVEEEHGAVELPHPDTLTPAAAECGGRIPARCLAASPARCPAAACKPGPDARSGPAYRFYPPRNTNPCAVAFLLWNFSYFLPMIMKRFPSPLSAVRPVPRGTGRNLPRRRHPQCPARRPHALRFEPRRDTLGRGRGAYRPFVRCAARAAVAQVAVVAVDDIAGGDVFEFAIDLFSAWGVGQARNDNGLGILLVKDRREIPFRHGRRAGGRAARCDLQAHPAQIHAPGIPPGRLQPRHGAGVEAVSQLLEGSELDLGGADTGGDELPAWAVFLIVTGFVVVPMGVILLVTTPASVARNAIN